MSDIANLYDQVMSETMDKVAEQTENQDVAYDADFFEKVAAGDDEAVNELNEFVDAARAEGASDEQIEEALSEAMEAAGYDEGEDEGEDEEYDEFEEAKMSAYMGGSEQAILDVLESDLAKEAEITIDDLLEYELGGHFGAGYAETRQEADEAIMKIAEAKFMEKEAKKGKSGILSQLRARLAKTHGNLATKLTPSTGAHIGPQSVATAGRAGQVSGRGTAAAMKAARKAEQAAARSGKRRATAVMAGGGAAGAAGLGGLGYGGYRLARGKKDKK